MTEDFFMRLCDVYGFAPSRALRELVDAAIGQAVVTERYKAARLAEPVQQGCEHCNQPLYAAVKCRVCGRVTSAEPVQEPVAWIDDSGHPKHLSHLQSATERRLYGPLRPLYTTPPPAEPVQEQPVCDECGKHKQDGWALYCVGCVEPMFAPPEQP